MADLASALDASEARLAAALRAKAELEQRLYEEQLIATETRAGLHPAAHMIECISWQRHGPPLLAGVEFPPANIDAAGPQPT